MTPNDILKDISFTHRPEARVSVGALQRGGKIYMAAAFANNGVSCTGNLRKGYRDQFSRVKARTLIAYRIIALLEGKQTKFACAFISNLGSRQFINGLRTEFKPNPDESDDTFMDVYYLDSEVGIRARMGVEEIWINVLAMSYSIAQKTPDIAKYTEYHESPNL